MQLTDSKAPLRALAVLVAMVLLLAAAACGGGDDDDGEADRTTTTVRPTTTTTNERGETEEEVEERNTPLEGDEARAAGNPDTYARIEALEDCDRLERERDNARENADRRRAENPRRASILEAYAEAAEDRMEELDC